MKLAETFGEWDGAPGFLKLSVLGGLTQFGAYVDTLAPGAASSERHWHDSEDEFLFMLDGSATLRDDHGAQRLTAGDAVCWPWGVANGHHLINDSWAACRYLIVGSRVAGDRCHYPDLGAVQINAATTWSVVGADGRVLRGGDLPPELLDAAPLWGERATGPYGGVLPAKGRIWVDEVDAGHRVLGKGLGPHRHAILGDAGGLSQFGFHLESLPPGSASSYRHWHEAKDEMVLMLSGTAVLVEDEKTEMRPGDIACWPARTPIGHCLINRSDAEACYIVIGARKGRDVIHYPDHDLVVHKDGQARAWYHADGRERRV